MLFTQGLAWLYPEAAREPLCARPLEGDMRGAVTHHELPASAALPASALPLVLLAPGWDNVCVPSSVPLLLPASRGAISVQQSPRPAFSWVLPSSCHGSKNPLKTTFHSRVCVLLPFQPFLSLRYFQSLTFSSHGSVFQSQAAEQALPCTQCSSCPLQPPAWPPSPSAAG